MRRSVHRRFGGANKDRGCAVVVLAAGADVAGGEKVKPDWAGVGAMQVDIHQAIIRLTPRVESARFQLVESA